MLSTIILSLLFIASSSATPIQRDSNKVTLGFAHKVSSLLGSQKNLAELDRVRANSFLSNILPNGFEKAKAIQEKINNTAVTYTAQVGIGSPPTEYTLLIDTGSSNTWIGADKKYVKTSSSKKSSGSVYVTYGSGTFSGTEYTESVTLAPGLTIKQQSIGVANQSSGFVGVDGILGIGPTRLTEGTVSNKKTVPTVTDNLFKSGAISSDELGIFFEPVEKGLSGEGQITWGGVDTTKVVGGVNYVPITSTEPASHFWGVNQTVTLDGKTILSQSAGIIDTGTTLVLLATDAFRTYQKAVGATLDKNTGLLKITSKQYSALKNLDFKIGSETYSLTPNAQIWPRSLNKDLGGEDGSIYLIVSDLGTHAGQGLDFINGYAFLERFYSVYDAGSRRVGFGKTKYTTATTN